MTAYTFTDPEREIIARVDAGVFGRPEAYFASVTTSTDYPTGQTGSPTVPHVQVAWDGTPTVDYPVTERAAVRITCWLGKGKRTDVKAMAGIVQAVLLANARGGSGLRAIHPGSGRIVGIDPDTGLSFCTFTVRPSTQPLAVS